MREEPDSRPDAAEAGGEDSTPVAGLPVTPSERAAAAGGLAPSALLDLPPDCRRILNWLARRRSASFAELKEAQPTSDDDLRRMLDNLIARQYVVEEETDGAPRFRVLFRGSHRGRSQGSDRAKRASTDLWSRLGKTDE